MKTARQAFLPPQLTEKERNDFIESMRKTVKKKSTPTASKKSIQQFLDIIDAGEGDGTGSAATVVDGGRAESIEHPKSKAKKKSPSTTRVSAPAPPAAGPDLAKPAVEHPEPAEIDGMVEPGFATGKGKKENKLKENAETDGYINLPTGFQIKE